VPILLALTVEGMRDDIYIGLFVRIRPKADGVVGRFCRPGKVG